MENNELEMIKKEIEEVREQINTYIQSNIPISALLRADFFEYIYFFKSTYGI